MSRVPIVVGMMVVVLVVAACSGADADRSPGTTLLDYPDAGLRAMWRAMREPRPVEGSAMPPRHLDPEQHPVTLVDRNEIVPGGPPPDGIPSIDDPVLAPIAEVDDLEPDEAVLVLTHGDEVRIYPVRIMIWHEIVNDVVDGTPITVTYCPLCNSAIAYERTVGGRVLDFGTSGYLYRSGLVMYDRQTESLWTHFDGRAVVGRLTGEQLDFRTVSTVSWEQASTAHPDAVVLRGHPDQPRPYGQNRYVAYDQADAPLSGWFNIDIPEPIEPMARVVGIRSATDQVAIPTSLLAERGAVTLSVDDTELVAFWRPGTASPLQRSGIADGDDIGATGVFVPRVEGRSLTFTADADAIRDLETGSRWNIRGQAVAGPLRGGQLDEAVHLDTFWFAWVAHHPGTRLVVRGRRSPIRRPGRRRRRCSGGSG